MLLAHAVGTLLVFATLLGLLLLLRARLVDRTGPKVESAITSLPRIIYYVLLNEYLVFLAWMDLVRGSYTVLWEKAESTRISLE